MTVFCLLPLFHSLTFILFDFIWYVFIMAVHNWKYGFQSHFIFNLLKRKFYQIYFSRFWMILLCSMFNVSVESWATRFRDKTINSMSWWKRKIYGWQRKLSFNQFCSVGNWTDLMCMHERTKWKKKKKKNDFSKVFDLRKLIPFYHRR